jgi:hypothetical protein
MTRVRRLGERYERHRVAWPSGQQIALRERAFELTIFLPRPRAQEVEAVRTSDQEILLAELPGVLVVATRWGFEASADGLDWVVAPYDHRRAAPTAPFPDWLRTWGAFELRTVLVDTDTGLIHALRVSELPPAGVRRVAAAIWRQVEEPVDADVADATVAGLPEQPEELATVAGARIEHLTVAAGDETLELPA